MGVTFQDPSSPDRQVALRIKRLTKGSVTFDSLLPVKCLGTIEKEAGVTKGTGEGARGGVGGVGR